MHVYMCMFQNQLAYIYWIKGMISLIPDTIWEKGPFWQKYHFKKQAIENGIYFFLLWQTEG